MIKKKVIIILMILALIFSQTMMAAAATGSSSAKPAKVTISSIAKSGKMDMVNKSLTVKWKKVDGADSYQVYRSTSKNGTYKKIATTSKLSWKDTTVGANRLYYYKVRAVDKVGEKTVYGNFSTPKSKRMYLECWFPGLITLKVDRDKLRSDSGNTTLRRPFLDVPLVVECQGKPIKNYYVSVSSKDQVTVKKNSDGTLVITPKAEMSIVNISCTDSMGREGTCSFRIQLTAEELAAINGETAAADTEELLQDVAPKDGPATIDTHTEGLAVYFPWGKTGTGGGFNMGWGGDWIFVYYDGKLITDFTVENKNPENGLAKNMGNGGIYCKPLVKKGDCKLKINHNGETMTLTWQIRW